jgi:hypothetical protein
MSIRLNEVNSKIIGGKIYITAIKAHNLNKKLSEFVIMSSKINYPKLGFMYEYTGPYTRNIKS